MIQFKLWSGAAELWPTSAIASGVISDDDDDDDDDDDWLH